jgi:hypothetical protein
MGKSKIHIGLRHEVYNLFKADKTIKEIIKITGAEKEYVEKKVSEFTRIMKSSYKNDNEDMVIKQTNTFAIPNYSGANFVLLTDNQLIKQARAKLT